MKSHKTILKWFNVLLAIFPILVIAFAIFRTGSYDLAAISDQLFSIVETPLIEPFYNFVLENLLGNVSNHYINIMFAFLSYLFYFELISLLLDFLLFIVRWARGFLNGFYEKY